jgi:hypothetical protein
VDITTLQVRLEDRDVQQNILGNYRGPYSLGVTKSSQPGEKFAVRLRVVGPVADKLPNVVTIDGEKISVIATDDFQAPRPLRASRGIHLG